MSIQEKYLAVASEHEELLELRKFYAKLVRRLGEEEDRRKLERIDAKLASLKREAARLEADRIGAGSEAAREADRYFEAVAHTSKIRDEFLDLIGGIQVSPPTPEAEQRISQALTTIGAKYGEHAAEQCQRMLPTAPRA